MLLEEKLIQFKIHIVGISPRIFRRFVVRDSTSISQLHHLIQMIVGWDGYFLHEFHIWGRYYGSFYSNDYRVPLSHFAFKEKDKFTYTYNFYEFWEHELRVEKITPLSLNDYSPKVISGKRACPIEGIGGAKYYYEEAISLLFNRDHIAAHTHSRFFFCPGLNEPSLHRSHPNRNSLTFYP